LPQLAGSADVFGALGCRYDAYGQALVNIHAALLEGIAVCDSSVAGLGGCRPAG